MLSLRTGGDKHENTHTMQGYSNWPPRSLAKVPVFVNNSELLIFLTGLPSNAVGNPQLGCISVNLVSIRVDGMLMAKQLPLNKDQIHY